MHTQSIRDWVSGKWEKKTTVNPVWSVDMERWSWTLTVENSLEDGNNWAMNDLLGETENETETKWGRNNIYSVVYNYNLQVIHKVKILIVDDNHKQWNKDLHTKLILFNNNINGSFSKAVYH